MKRITCLFILSALLASCARPSSKVVIDGEVEGYEYIDTVQVILLHVEGEYAEQFLVDTLRDGRFRFEIDSLPAGSNAFYLGLFSIKSSRMQGLGYSPDLYLEPGAHVHVKGQGKHFYTAEITSPVKDQQLRQRFLKKMSQTDWDHYQDLYVDYDALVADYYTEGFTDWQRDSVRATFPPLKAKMDSISDILDRQQMELMKSEPVGQFWMKRLNTFAKVVAYKMHPEYRPAVESLFAALPPERKESPEGQEIESLLFPIQKVHAGDAMPKYEYVDHAGKARSISEFLGKTVLLDFWGNGCGACVQSIPYLQRLHDRYGDRLALVSINLDPDQIWKKSEKEHPMTWENWRDPSGSSGSIRFFSSREIPTFVVISPEGTVLDISLGFDEEHLQEVIESDEK